MSKYDVINERNGKVYIVPSRGGDHSSAHLALQKALNSGGSVVFPSGSYRFEDPLQTVGGAADIEISASASWITRSTDSLGFLDLAADRLHIHGGGQILVEDHVNDQNALTLSGTNLKIQDITFKSTSEGGLNANPSTFVRLNAAVEKHIHGCTFVPSAGVICVHSVNGNRTMLVGNHVTSQTTLGQGGGESPGMVGCTGGFWLQGDEWFKVMGNTFFGVGDAGDVADENMLFCVRATMPSDPVGSEGGHSIVSGNHIEFARVDRAIEWQGVLWSQISGNLIGYLSEGPTAATHAAIWIDSSDLADTGVPTGYCHITGNQFHNCEGNTPTGDAAYINVRRGVSCSINSNQFVVVREGHTPVRVQTDISGNVMILYNHFETAENNGEEEHANEAIVFSGTALTTERKCAVVGNLNAGFTGGFLDANNETTNLIDRDNDDDITFDVP